MRLIASYLVGLLFGAGLLLSGMTNPNNVRGFLDITGKWNPSLALVMVGGLVIYRLVYMIARRMKKPIGESKFLWPTRTEIDRRLIPGGVLFGVGWGLSGYCPGPAWVGIVRGGETLIFVIAMLGGMGLGHYWNVFRAAQKVRANSSERTRMNPKNS